MCELWSAGCRRIFTTFREEKSILRFCEEKFFLSVGGFVTDTLT